MPEIASLPTGIVLWVGLVHVLTNMATGRAIASGYGVVLKVALVRAKWSIE